MYTDYLLKGGRGTRYNLMKWLFTKLNDFLPFDNSAENTNFCCLMSGSCHFDRGSIVEIGVECQIFVIVIFLSAAEFYNLGHIQGIIWVH